MIIRQYYAILITLLLEVLQYVGDWLFTFPFFIMKSSRRSIISWLDWRVVNVHLLRFFIKITLELNVRHLYRVTQLRNRSCRSLISWVYSYISSACLI
jgi:hypothetical protein